jgi:hypothetical protein
LSEQPFRDYYDVFVLLKEGIVSVDQLIQSSIAYNSKLKEPMIRSRLSQWQKFSEEKAFKQLAPKYDLAIREIGEAISKMLS